MKSCSLVLMIAASLILAACGGGSMTSTSTTTPTTYTVTAAVSGLGGGTLVLQDNNTDNTSITANGNYPIASSLASGTAYAITIFTQPNGQTCTLGSNATGNITANTTVTVTCVNNTATTFTLGVTVTGLASPGSLTVQDAPGDSLTFTTNNTQTFATTYTSGATYTVTVTTQPSGQTCGPTPQTGTITANTVVTITCTTPPPVLTLSAAATGLTGTATLTVEDDQGVQLSLTASSSSQMFSNTYVSGATYSVSILTQPSGENCTPPSASGTITQNTTVTFTCTANAFTIGGTISGYTGTGLVLQDNDGNNLTVNQGATSFTFAGTVPTGTAYSVTFFAQPNTPTQTCQTQGTTGSGTVGTANVTSIVINCTTNTYTIGGTVTGLTGTGLQLQDNLTNTTPITGTGTVPFTFSTPIASGGAYSVTVLTQPSGQSCTATQNGNGTVTNANITNVVVTCSASTSVNVWTWQNGSEDISQPGSYLVKRTPGGFPGARYGATTWIDLSGNLWVFGGIGYAADAANENYLNDLWEYTPSTNQWTWISGANVVETNGTYGTGGTSVPGARYGAAGWRDSSGNLWLFGGYGLDSVTTNPAGNMNDLWEFTNGQWDYISGSETNTNPPATPNYGTKGVAATTNIPGGRYDSSFAADASGNFWLFGGEALDVKGNVGSINDIWEYTNGGWIYQGGSETINASGIYPTTPGTSTSTTIPGAREGQFSWFDSLGNFWVFAGNGFDSNGDAGYLNDLWSFNGTQWTWVGGSNVIDQPASYGTEGVANSSNVPGSRMWSAGSIDPSGNVWIFGGQQEGDGQLTDLWEYTAGGWIWMSGSQSIDQTGIYGTEGQASSGNMPGSRQHGQAWSDPSGNFWLFGGFGWGSVSDQGIDAINDLWEYKP
jgi:Kelch motif